MGFTVNDRLVDTNIERFASLQRDCSDKIFNHIGTLMKLKIASPVRIKLNFNIISLTMN